MIQGDIFQLNSSVLWQDLGKGIKRQLFGYDDQLMMVKVKFESGAVGELHQHVHSQVSYVESGVFALVIGDERKTLSTGDGYYVPPNTIHGCVCIEPGILIDVFTPHRQDFL